MEVIPLTISREEGISEGGNCGGLRPGACPRLSVHMAPDDNWR